MSANESFPKADLGRIAIPVADLDRSAAFYGDTLGLVELEEQGEPGVRWYEWSNGVVLGLTLLPPDAGAVTAPLQMLLRVDDIEGLRRRFAAGKVVIEPGTVRRGGFWARDPDGHRLLVAAGRGIAARMDSRSRVVGQRLLLEEEIRVRGTPENAWTALTDPALLSAWLCGGPARIDPRRGGALELTFPHIGRAHTTWSCEILDFIPPARLRFKEQVLDLEVSLDLAPETETETRIRLTQTPFPLAEFGEPPDALAQRLALSWRRILRRLELLMEDELTTGEPDGGKEPD